MKISEPIDSAIRTPAIVNQIRRLPTASNICQRFIFCCSAPMNRGLSNQRKPARSPRKARVAKTAVKIEMTVPSRSMKANPRTPPVATANRTSAVIAVTTFASTMVAKPFL